MNAVKPILSDWMRIFEETQVEKIEAKTLTSQELANSFHREVKQFPTGKARVAKESFGPIFTDQAAEKDASQDEKNDKKNKKKSRC